MAKQQKRHVETYVGSMQRHIHMHKNLQSAMLTVWRNCLFAHKSGAEKQLRNQNRTQTTNSLVAP